ncbi:UbiA-like polyprenyltransferase [Pyrodictium occultum]|uniref:UbiA-like polyprenyltransferase n=1 Tax=Pyrodictium occultum TaxID=2309 RepID=UPI000ABBB353|nr:UbiA-like polyprenyltransferase [Pyrodictium occultum]
MARAAWDPGRLSRRSRLHALMRLVRIEHTLFSLPFAYAGAVLACPRCLGPREAALIALAVLGLRTAAMAYNNIADLDIDRLNPRTRSRPLVAGAVGLRDAWALVAAGSLLYYASAALLNRYALLLSPLLWLAAITYPHAKRLHWLPHLHLGLVLGSVVFGGAVAAYGGRARGAWDLLHHVPWLYVAAVALWVAGFDTYYAIMDMEFDRSMGLGSIPARLGPRGALWASRLMHAAAAVLMLASVPAYGLGPAAAAGLAAAALLLAYQHLLLARRGLEAVPRAFNTNLALGLAAGLGVLADRLLALAGL